MAPGYEQRDPDVQAKGLFHDIINFLNSLPSYINVTSYDNAFHIVIPFIYSITVILLEVQCFASLLVYTLLIRQWAACSVLPGFGFSFTVTIIFLFS